MHSDSPPSSSPTSYGVFAPFRKCWGQPEPQAQLIASGGASGWEWRNEVGKWCLLFNIASDAPHLPRAEQTQLVLEKMSHWLTRRGFNFGDVVRTWFFLDDILDWYDTFNQVRTGFFERHKLLGRMPASTAVGPELSGPLILAGLVAVQVGAETAVRIVSSPAQGSAFDYGSSFSRAVEVAGPNSKRLYVSGTASIDSVGRTKHPGQLLAQTNETLNMVEQLLLSRNLRFADVGQAVAYVPHGRDAEAAQLCASERLGRSVPMIAATICRSDLEFEIELLASRGGHLA